MKRQINMVMQNNSKKVPLMKVNTWNVELFGKQVKCLKNYNTLSDEHNDEVYIKIKETMVHLIKYYCNIVKKYEC